MAVLPESTASSKEDVFNPQTSIEWAGMFCQTAQRDFPASQLYDTCRSIDQ